MAKVLMGVDYNKAGGEMVVIAFFIG